MSEEEPKDHEIMLVRATIDCHECGNGIIEKIGAWTKVTKTDYNILVNWRYRHGYEVILRNPPSVVDSSLRTPEQYIASYHKEQEANKKRIKERQKIDEAKRLERKKKQLEKLKKELGESI